MKTKLTLGESVKSLVIVSLNDNVKTYNLGPVNTSVVWSIDSSVWIPISDLLRWRIEL